MEARGHGFYESATETVQYPNIPRAQLPGKWKTFVRPEVEVDIKVFLSC